MDSRGKGLWSEIVRRSNPQSSVQSIADDPKEKLPDFEAEAGSISCKSAANGLPLEAVGLPLNCNGEMEGSPEAGAADSASEASPKPLRSPWKKPSKVLNDSWEGPVMWADSWPSLADSRSGKHPTSPRSAVAGDSAEENSAKELTKGAMSSGRKNMDSDDRLLLGLRKTEARKQASDAATTTILLSVPETLVSEMVVQGPLNLPPHESMPVARASNSSPGNNIGRGQMPNHKGNNGEFFDNAWMPQKNRNGRFSGRGGIPHQHRDSNGMLSGPGGMHNQNGANGFYPRHIRAPRQRGNNGAPHTNTVNRRMYRDQGRGANNWHSQQFLTSGPNHGPTFHLPFFDPRSVHWGVPTVFHPDLGFFNPPVPEGMVYPSMGSPGLPQGAGFYAHPGALHVLPPGLQNARVEYFLAKQIEYYFSNENLVKDAFLRSKMDAEGFVPTSLIASFNKIKMFNADTNMILNALQKSSVVEVQGENLRKRYDWPLWVLPPKQPNMSSNADSGTSSAEASDNHSICSSKNIELTSIDGGNVHPNVDPEPCLQQSAAAILDKREASMPQGNAEPKTSQFAKENAWSSFYPNEDAVDTNK